MAGLLFTAAVEASPIFHVVDLGALDGGVSYGAALSENGVAVGWSSEADGTYRGVMFDGSLIALAGGNESQANDANQWSTVVGTVWSEGLAQATIWKDDQVTPVGTLGGGESYGAAINDHGQVAGTATDAAGNGHAFLYSGGQITELFEKTGWQWSSGLALNNGGAVAGTVQLANGNFRGAVWKDGEVSELGTLGGANSYAMGISDGGLVVGGSTVAAGWMHAFLYTGGMLLDLGTLGGGNSTAYDVNDRGWVVGFSLTPDGAWAAFLYTSGVMYDLNALIDGEWVLEEARAVNKAGQIVGTGRINGERHAFRLDPLMVNDGVSTIQNPEPGTFLLAMLGTGLLAMGLYRRRRR
jgi:probable HAF family extracellular repeat protein